MPDIGTAITGGTAVLGAVSGGDSASSAADTQAEAGEKSIKLQKEMFDTVRADQAPWRQAGGQAVTRLSDLLGLDPAAAAAGAGPTDSPSTITIGGVKFDPEWYAKQRPDVVAAVGSDPNALWSHYQRFGKNEGTSIVDPNYGKVSDADLASRKSDPAFGSLMKDFSATDFEKDPGYDFRMSEGQKALERSAAARGGLVSGRGLKEISRYGQDYASGEFDKAYNRFQTNRSTKYNQLSNLAGLGQTSANTTSNAAQNYGQNAGDVMTQIGNVRAAGQVGQSNAFTTGLNGITNNLSSMFNGGGSNGFGSGTGTYNDPYGGAGIRWN